MYLGPTVAQNIIKTNVYRASSPYEELDWNSSNSRLCAFIFLLVSFILIVLYFAISTKWMIAIANAMKHACKGQDVINHVQGPIVTQQ